MLHLEQERFGRLTVLYKSGTDKYKNVLWMCECACGKHVLERTGDLRSGKVKSCGCLRADLQRNKKN